MPKQLKSTFRNCAAMLVATLVIAGGAVTGEAQRVIKVDGCSLLNHPAKYNRHEVEIEALAYADFEHLDLRFPCNGYIHLDLSNDENSKRKYGFETVNNDLMSRSIS